MHRRSVLVSSSLLHSRSYYLLFRVISRGGTFFLLLGIYSSIFSLKIMYPTNSVVLILLVYVFSSFDYDDEALFEEKSERI